MKQIQGTMFFDQIPKGTAQMKRVNHRTGNFFMSKDVRLAHDAYMEQLLDYVPEKPFEGPLSLGFIFSYTIKDKKKRGTPKTSRPDCDNLVKLVMDVMTELGFWVDDAQVTKLRIEKRWSLHERANVYFNLEEVVE